jgi:hypothetical protein
MEQILLYALTVAAEQMPEVKVRPSAVQSAVSLFRHYRCAALSDVELTAMLKTPEQLFKMFALYTETSCSSDAKRHKTLH